MEPIELANAVVSAARSISGVRYLEDAGKELGAQLRQMLGADAKIGVFVRRPEAGPSLVHAEGLEVDELFNLQLLAVMESTALDVFSARDLVARAVQEEELLNKGLKGVVGIPLFSRQELEGAIILISSRDEAELREMGPFITAISAPFLGELVNFRLYSQLEDLYLSTILALASAIDAKHPYTRGHSERVTRYAVAIGREMGLDKDTLSDLRISALLHDVGKIGVKDVVLDKNGKLTDDEYLEIRRHPVIGAQIVGKISNSERIVPGILDHHERYDGKGYPSGKRGEEISLFGRIIAVADTFDAMTSTRSYRKALPFQVAVEEIVYNAGYQFDPKVVKHFVQAYEKQKNIWQRENIIHSVY